MIHVDTLQYEASHGHKPRQPRGAQTATFLNEPALDKLVAWQSSIDRLIRIDSPSRHEWWFEEKEIPHGQISCHPHG